MRIFSQLKEILKVSVPIDRKSFFISGTILFFIKYGIDRSLSYFVFNREWWAVDYIKNPTALFTLDPSSEDFVFYFTLIGFSLPFLYLGTILCLKRLRSIGLSSFWVFLFFVPALNFLMFFLLCVLPENLYNVPGSESSAEFIPKSKLIVSIWSILITASITLLFSLFSTDILKTYGASLFIGGPFIIGFTSVALYSRTEFVGFKQALLISASSISLAGFLTFIIAMEGAICLIMAAPLAYFLGFIGGGIAYLLQAKSRFVSSVLPFLFLILPSVAYLEANLGKESDWYMVETSLKISAPKENVWKGLFEFSDIPEPKELIFNAGVSYPVRARVEGKGIGAIRYCEFNNGVFVEKITKWDDNNSLEFDVVRQPDAMRELSPYKNIRPTHLDGYFASKKGSFQLVSLGKNETLLIGRTWFLNKFGPTSYWNVGIHWILHKIHYRVLDHIRNSVEVSS
ncbi:hypothetical protein CH352_01820 [Leptospira hartskeerlii]|uniref:Polyketide cyclase n=1 Tax=Leptospira hartskeerlii TaxID=2023177 RepID=A0A2M9XDM1_9LEPT|nr:hypothetical protein [Leptospira hartskeerlii]PJZ25795.1 hypothetical protein CH357_09155 [Leptospira hartskeerlii]PJZ35382.1 hypothetical protein CH352_01820 [Leptospira hartskeerlii]